MIDPNVSTAVSDMKLTDGEDPEAAEGNQSTEGACALPPNDD